MHEVQARGWIGAWGVSNFDGSAMRALLTVDGAGDCALNQIYYSLSERGPEFDLLALHDRHGVSTMAYCPLDQGALVDHPALRPIARRHGATMAQVALAKIASGADSDGFYAAKLATARFYFARILPRTAMHHAAALAGAETVMALAEDQFAF